MRSEFIDRPLGSMHSDDVEITSRLLNIIFDMPMDQQLELLKLLDANGFKGARRHDRTCLKNPWVVMVDPENAFQGAVIRDISRCGMFIETGRAFVVGQEIVLKFQVPASRKIFKIIGEIVRCEKCGVGVRFKRQVSESEGL